VRLISIIAICLSLFSVNYAIGSNQDIWEQANTAYDNNSFDKALEGYLQLLERGSRSPEIYYNLGNVYFKTNKIGMAIAAYRLRLKLDPSFIVAKENLAYVRNFTIDKVEKPSEGFIQNIWLNITKAFSAEGYFKTTIMIYWLLSLIITISIIRIGKKEFFTYMLILLAVLFILGSVLSYFVINETVKTKWGVIISASAELREGPGEDFDKIFTGHEGLEFKILSQRQDYYLVELTNGLKGWINRTTLTEI
jgi:tetratricopeptide (TPR) repeat protein